MKKRINFLTLLSLIICLIPFVVYFYLHSQLPESIPIHYNLSGTADRFVSSSSYEVLFLCSFGLLGFIFMKLTSFMIIKFTSSLQENNLKTTSLVMNAATFFTVLLFNILSIYFLLVSANIKTLHTNTIFSISNFVLGLLAIVIGNYMPKFRHSRFSGFRTGATLSDETVWLKTQRFAARSWIIGGIALLVLSVAFSSALLIFPLVLSPLVYLLMTAVPFVYSYKLLKSIN